MAASSDAIASWLDRLGGAASAACAIHCLSLALAPALLPMLGLGFLAGESTEWFFLAASVPLGVVSGMVGFRRHRSRSVALSFAVGLLLVVLGRWMEAHGQSYPLGPALLVLGGALLVAAHLGNLRGCRDCPRASD